MRGYFVKNIGQNRGKPRIWLQNLEISKADMKPGDRYDVHIKGGTVVLRVNPDGSRVVSAKENKATGEKNPVIDINSKELLALFDGMSSIRLVQRKGEIYLLPLASELRKKERLNRIAHKVTNGLPLSVGSLSHGGGLLSNAVHEGFRRAGLKSSSAMVNEIRPELLEHSSNHSGVWDEGTMPVAAPMQEFAFDEAAMRHVPRMDVMEAGLPCSGASVAGRAKRNTAKPEDHPEVGHLVVAALVIISKANPAVLILENVVPYASSASASILRNQLRDLGYDTHETVLKGADFNALEHRDRWFMVAVTQGMHFDWEMLKFPEKRDLKLSDIMDDIAEDDPAWSEMTGLKAKQERDIAAGKGFRMQIVDGEDTRIPTLTKGLAKNRSTDPKFRHPTNPDLLRMPTPGEHAKVKQFPPSIVEGLSKTIAHEVLGQGVLRDPPVAASELVGDSVKQFVIENELSTATLVKSMAGEILDSASMVVSELRAPVARVVYEGPVTISDLGMVVQDIGNGVGILHKHDALSSAKIGEVLRVQYPNAKAEPDIERLSTPAPAQSPQLKMAIDAAEHLATTKHASSHDHDAHKSSPMPRMG